MGRGVLCLIFPLGRRYRSDAFFCGRSAVSPFGMNYTVSGYQKPRTSTRFGMASNGNRFRRRTVSSFDSRLAEQGESGRLERMNHKLLSVFICSLGIPVLGIAAPKPNILFIISDDQAPDTIGALCDQEVATPNLDKLIADGTTFTHCFNQGSWSGAVCVASRTMLITGQTVFRAPKNKAYLDGWAHARGPLAVPELEPETTEEQDVPTVEYISLPHHRPASAP